MRLSSAQVPDSNMLSSTLALYTHLHKHIHRNTNTDANTYTHEAQNDKKMPHEEHRKRVLGIHG